jgi:hypothetical protein
MKHFLAVVVVHHGGSRSWRLVFGPTAIFKL